MKKLSILVIGFLFFAVASLHSIKAQEENASFIPVNDLKIGDWVFVKGDEENLVPEKITKLERIEGPVEVYNLSVEGEETFFANGFAVHNKGENLAPQCGVEIQPQVGSMILNTGRVAVCDWDSDGSWNLEPAFNVTPGKIYEIKSHSTQWSNIDKSQPYCPEKGWYWGTCNAPYYRVDTDRGVKPEVNFWAGGCSDNPADWGEVTTRTYLATGNTMTITVGCHEIRDWPERCQTSGTTIDWVQVREISGAGTASSSTVNLRVGFWDDQGFGFIKIQNPDGSWPDWSDFPMNDTGQTFSATLRLSGSIGSINVRVMDYGDILEGECSDTVSTNKPPAIAGIVPDPSPVCSLGDESSKSTIITTYQDQDEPANLVVNGSFENGTTGWSLEPKGTGVIQLDTNAVYGSKAIYVKGGGGGNTRVIQWVPINNNTAYTVSLTSKKTGGVVAADEWCLGGAYQQGHWFSQYPNYQREKWSFTSKTCAAGQDHRLAIYFDAYTSSDEIWVDGVLLEQGSTAGLWTDIQTAYFGLAPCGATGEAYCKNFEQNLANYFGAVYYPSTNSVRVARDSYGASTCSGGSPSANCPWRDVSSFPVSNEDGTVKLTGVRPKVEGSNLRIEWDLVFDGLPLATYNLYGMVVDKAGAWQNPSGPQWDDKGDITLKECITDPWFQTQGGDVHGQGDIRSKIPTTATNKNFCMDLDNYPGVVSYAGTTANFTPAGTASSRGWLANSPFASGQSIYDYFYKKLDSPTVDNFKNSQGRRYCDEVACPTPAGTTIYYVDGDLNIQDNSNWAVPATSKIVVLINGNLNIKLTGNRKITVAQGGFLGLIVNGNINIDGNIGDKQVAVTPYLEGVYLAVGDTSIIDTYEPDPAGPGLGSGKRLVSAGLFYARSGFNLQRDLKDDCSDPLKVCNARNPAELFIFRPDLVLNAPKELWVSKMSWLEVAP